jgi:hypothetical protein
MFTVQARLSKSARAFQVSARVQALEQHNKEDEPDLNFAHALGDPMSFLKTAAEKDKKRDVGDLHTKDLEHITSDPTSLAVSRSTDHPGELSDLQIKQLDNQDHITRQLPKAQKLARKFHYRTHINMKHLIRTACSVDGHSELAKLPLNFQLDPPCLTCLLAKGKAAPLPKGPVERARVNHYRTFSDLSGRMRVRSSRGGYYGAIMLDDSSDFSDLAILVKKSDYKEAYKARNIKHGVVPKILRTDGGGEFIDHDFEQHPLKEGTHHEKSAPE